MLLFLDIVQPPSEDVTYNEAHPTDELQSLEAIVEELHRNPLAFVEEEGTADK